MNYSEKLQNYLILLEKSYSDTVEYLLNKYGLATDDYYSEKSYEKFLRGEQKTLTKKKAISRTSEGLYCHHIDEDKYENMTKEYYIRNQEIPYKHQVKERLVYCDLIEHTIMHAQIAKETNRRFGIKGFNTFLLPEIVEWFVEQRIPLQVWQQNCYHSAYLTPEEAEVFVTTITNYVKRITPFYSIDGDSE